jgi:hypothetical protein
MLQAGIMMALLLLSTSLAAADLEIKVGFKAGKPTAKEFVLAAKRAFYRRNYETSVNADGNVIGVYKQRLSMTMILDDSGVIIRNSDPANYSENKIKGYLKNLERDLVYELAEYML